jgi:alpha,alpha-trehalase
MSIRTVSLLFLVLISHIVRAGPDIVVAVSPALEGLVRDEDTDGDTRITIDDAHIIGTERGDKCHWILSTDGERVQVCGTYYLSALLQELKRAQEEGRDTVRLSSARVYEPPADRIARSIREVFWDGLTRRIDEQGLAMTIADEKTTTIDGMHYVYVPHDDTTAFSYFSDVARRHHEWRMKVVALPETVTAEYVRKLDGHHGLLTLLLRRGRDGSLHGVPFVVPGGRFNEMYGWDSYFIVLGLLKDGRVDLARGMVDQFVYEIHHYGAVLNANRTYYLTRSQPPFLTSMARAVYESLPHDPSTKEWLKRVLEASIQEYRRVWTNRNRMTGTGLSRYFDSGYGPPPEVEPGHFDPVFSRFARQFGMGKEHFEKAYRTGTLRVPELDTYFINDRAMRESGHDTSYRLEGVCADLVTVDLNTLLFKIENDIADILDTVFSGSIVLSNGGSEQSAAWRTRAQRRRELMNTYLWDEDRGSFFDYNIQSSSRTGYVSATCLYPLWGRLATPQQAERMVRTILPLLEVPGGVVASAEQSRGPIMAMVTSPGASPIGGSIPSRGTQRITPAPSRKNSIW